MVHSIISDRSNYFLLEGKQIKSLIEEVTIEQESSWKCFGSLMYVSYLYCKSYSLYVWVLDYLYLMTYWGSYDMQEYSEVQGHESVPGPCCTFPQLYYFCVHNWYLWNVLKRTGQSETIMHIYSQRVSTWLHLYLLSKYIRHESTHLTNTLLGFSYYCFHVWCWKCLGVLLYHVNGLLFTFFWWKITWLFD